MSDAIWERDGWYLNRFWGGNERKDCIQITSPNDCIQMTIGEFFSIVRALNDNLDATKDAWWHKLSKGEVTI